MAIRTGEYRSLFAELRCTRFVAHLSAIYISRFTPDSLKIVAAPISCEFHDRKMNLHSLWDTALVELEQGTPAEIAARIQAAVTDQDRQQWHQGSPADWGA